DLQTVGLNRTSVGFGAGETTFGWMFYPRVQTPQPVSNFRNVTNLLTGTGQGINADLRSRRIEPGQRECIALIVTPNFIPALRVSTVANWFDITGHCARPQLTNQEMLGMGRMLQQAKAAVARACDSGEYRPTDFVVLNQRIKQLEDLLPTQDTRVDLPDEGDLLGSEIFSPNAAGLSPSLLAWYGEPIQEGTAGSIFLMGRGFSVSETQVVVGGMPLHKGTEFRLISRNVMQIIVPATARPVKVQLDDEGSHANASNPKAAVATLNMTKRPTVEAKGGKAKVQVGDNMAHAELDPTLKPDVDVTINSGLGSSANVRGATVNVRLGDVQASAEGSAKPAMEPCDRSVIDVHIATPNGISNHLYVEVIPKPKAPKPQDAVTTATTTTTVNGNTTTTSTKFETTPPGTVLPPLTVLPMGTHWPPFTALAPGSVTGAPANSLMPGIVPTVTPPAAAPLSLTPTTTTTTTHPAQTVPAPPVSTTTAPRTSTTPAAPAAPAPSLPAPTPGSVPMLEPLPATSPPRASGSSSANPTTPGPDGVAVVGMARLPMKSDWSTLRVAASNSSQVDIPLPLPTERSRPIAAKGATSSRVGNGRVQADQSADHRVRLPFLRRIGLPDR
ncbi:MAG: hypothetical protein WA746_14800, partial [Isosphaeraceae bacterium]